MDVGDVGAGAGGQDRGGVDLRAARLGIGLHQPGEGDDAAMPRPHPVGLRPSSAVAPPLVEAGGRDQRAAMAHRGLERRLLGRRLGARVEKRRQLVRVLRPAGDQAPAHQQRAAVGQVRAGLAPRCRRSPAGSAASARCCSAAENPRRRAARRTLRISSGVAVSAKRPHILLSMPLDSSGTRWRLEAAPGKTRPVENRPHDSHDRTNRSSPPSRSRCSTATACCSSGAAARRRAGSMPFPAGASKPARRWRRRRGASSPRKPGWRSASSRRWCGVPVEGDDVDYDLQVFFGRYAGGEPVAADDADEAASSRSPRWKRCR